MKLASALIWANGRGAASSGRAAFTVTPRCSPLDLVRLWCGELCCSLAAPVSGPTHPPLVRELVPAPSVARAQVDGIGAVLGERLVNVDAQLLALACSEGDMGGTVQESPDSEPRTIVAAVSVPSAHVCGWRQSSISVSGCRCPLTTKRPYCCGAKAVGPAPAGAAATSRDPGERLIGKSLS